MIIKYTLVSIKNMKNMKMTFIHQMPISRALVPYVHWGNISSALKACSLSIYIVDVYIKQLMIPIGLMTGPDMSNVALISMEDLDSSCLPFESAFCRYHYALITRVLAS